MVLLLNCNYWTIPWSQLGKTVARAPFAEFSNALLFGKEESLCVCRWRAKSSFSPRKFPMPSKWQSILMKNLVALDFDLMSISAFKLPAHQAGQWPSTVCIRLFWHNGHFTMWSILAGIGTHTHTHWTHNKLLVTMARAVTSALMRTVITLLFFS